MTLDENALRAAGLPASLISLLVSVTRAAERAQAAANNAAIANELAPQLQAAIEALDQLEIAPDLDARIRDAIDRLSATETSVSEVRSATNDLSAATTALAEDVASLPPALIGADINGSALVLTFSDGSQIVRQLPAVSEGPQNRAPVATSIPIQTIAVGSPYAFDITDYVTDPEEMPLAFTVSGALPDGIAHSDGRFSGVATRAGVVTVSVRATDPLGAWADVILTFSVAAASAGQIEITPIAGGFDVRNPGATFPTHTIIPAVGGFRMELA